MLAEGFLMRFRARLPLRARGCAIPSTEQRPSRDFHVRRDSGLSGGKSQSRRGFEVAEVDEFSSVESLKNRGVVQRFEFS